MFCSFLFAYSDLKVTPEEVDPRGDPIVSVAEERSDPPLLRLKLLSELRLELDDPEANSLLTLAARVKRAVTSASSSPS